MLDFRIETFLCVCRHMNYTHAANELNITQPAVSQHIRFLEGEYQTRLFEQKGKQIFLTEAGKILRTVSTTMHRDEIQLKKMLIKTKKTTELRFGASLTVGQFQLPAKLACYLKQHPDITVYMVVDNTGELCRLLDAGDIDFAVIEGNFPKKEYDYKLYKREPYLPVCSSSHQFKKSPTILSNLCGEVVVVREKGSGGRDILEHALSSANLSLSDFKNTLEINNIHAMKSLVSLDLGITFLYETTIIEEIERGILKTFSLSDFSVTHDINFIWRKGSVFEEYFNEIYQIFTDSYSGTQT